MRRARAGAHVYLVHHALWFARVLRTLDNPSPRAPLIRVPIAQTRHETSPLSHCLQRSPENAFRSADPIRDQTPPADGSGLLFPLPAPPEPLPMAPIRAPDIAGPARDPRVRFRCTRSEPAVAPLLGLRWQAAPFAIKSTEPTPPAIYLLMTRPLYGSDTDRLDPNILPYRR